MARRKRKIEDDWPEPTPEKQLSIPSGWCSTNYHDGCRYQFTYGKCPCECHKKDKPKRGRPRKTDV